MSHLQALPGASDDDVDAALDVTLLRLRDGDDTSTDPLDALVAALATTGELPEDLANRHVAALTSASTSWGARASTSWGARASTTWRPSRRSVRTAVGGGVLAVTMLGGVGAAAASSALPGETLYGLKTARERVVVALAHPGDDRAAVHLAIARTRLGESATLLRRGRTELGIKTLARADAALAAATAAGSDDIDKRADAALDNRVAVLSALLDGGLPEQAADAAREAIERALSRDQGKPDEPGSSGQGRNDGTRDGTPATTPGGPPATAPGSTQRPTAKPTPAGGRPAPAERPHGRPATRPTGRPASR